MTANRTAPFFARLLTASEEPDAELIRRFAASRDATAFEMLVRRHGPMVLGICRRTLVHTHDAEDAFQAVFLVLAQKASTICDANSLSAWLYGVALRVAKKAKSRAASRREEARAEVPEPTAKEQNRDIELGPILDEELAALAEHYRSAILLCDVQELSRTEAAEKLGIPEGTLSSRLAKGRKLLAAKLAKRGITLSVPLMASVASAAVPEKLVQHTLEMLSVWSVGGTVSKPILELARGGTTMFAKVMLMGVSALAMTALGVGLANDPAKPEEKKAEVKAEAKAEVVYGKPRLKVSVEVELSAIRSLGWTKDGKVWINGRGTYAYSISQNGQTILQEAVDHGVFFYRPDEGVSDTVRAVPFEKPASRFRGFTKDGKSVVLETNSLGRLNTQDQVMQIPINQEMKLGQKYPKPAMTVPKESDYDEFLGFTNANKSFVALEVGSGNNTFHRKMHQRSVATGEVEETLLDVKNASMVYHSADFNTIAWIVVEQREVAPSPGASGNPRPKENYAAKIEVRTRGKSQTWSTVTPNNYQIAEVKLTPDGATLLVSYRQPRRAEQRGFGGSRSMPKEVEPKVDQPEGILVGHAAVTGREVFRITNESAYFERMELSDDRKLIALVGNIEQQTTRQGGGERVISQQASKSLLVYETATGKILKQWSLADRNRETGAVRKNYEQVHWAFSPTSPTLLIAEPGEKSDHTSLGLWEFPVVKK